MKIQFIAVLFVTGLFGQIILVNAQDKLDKTASFRGKVFRSDTEETVAKARVSLIDEKRSAKRDNSLETLTDTNGFFFFEHVVAGKYTLAISIVFEKEDELPCHMDTGLRGPHFGPYYLGETVSMECTVDDGYEKLATLVTVEGNKFVEKIQIKGFRFTPTKNYKRDFNIVCQCPQ